MKRFAAIATIAIAGAIAGCGGSDDEIVQPNVTHPSTTTAAGTLTKEEFIAEADPICAEATLAINSQEEAADQADFGRQSAQIAEIYEGVAEDLRDLGPPAEDSEQLDEFLTATDDAVEAFRQQAEAADGSSDPATIDAAGQDAAAALERARIAGEQYGFQNCGSQNTEAGSTDPAVPGAPGAGAPGAGAPATPAPSEGGGASPDGGSDGGDSGGGDSGGGDSGGVGAP